MALQMFVPNATDLGGYYMTIDELQGELKALLDFKQWLEEKLLAVEIDIAGNEQEQEDILNAMENTL